MDIGGWLRSLGLEHYEAAFRENEIDETVLPKLTAEDLKDLGVSIVGHRRKLLDAITALRGDGPATRLADELPSSRPNIVAVEDRGERRQVTVMFSDLVGSTALSARMDPEDLREIITAYQKCVVDTVRRFGGFVAKYLGDGVLAYFGYPQAHEDDAERAVRAGLEQIAAVGALKSAATLQTRVGIATGLVVVGDLIGSGEAQERGIVGETPNLAARLQGVARPNAVVIAEGTRKLVGNLFEFEDLGAQELKGISGPVRAWAALRPSAVESRFEALRAGGLTELVGRDEELDLLLRRWAKAKSGPGQVVLLSGEAGIGKSRLTAALRERLVGKPHTQLRCFCSPQHKDSPLYPIIGQMQFAAGFTHEDSLQAKLDKLETMLAQTSTPIENAAIFADMLSLANDGRYPDLALLPQQRREKTFKALISQLCLLARDCPVLMIFEDAHWIDPTSLDALGRIVDQIATIRVLLIMTFRPEFEAPWIGRSYVTTLTINRLATPEILEMIGRVIGNKFLPENLRQDIITRADGIPLFVEEITKAVMEAESEGEARKTIATVPSPALAVPATLHASLMARLDRLGPAKEVAQIGAAIGRDFSHALLAAIACKTEEELGASLDRLIAAGLLFRQGVPPHANYLFKHVLVRDAAYGTLLRSRRQELHRKIVSVLQRDFAELVVSQPEQLAHHCSEAGMIAEAIDYCLLAAQRATAAWNNVEKIAHIARGITLVEQLPSSDQRTADFRIRLTLGGAGFLL
jgi:class 3 adenylate cyclase